jgi:hypothetical protein
MSEERETADSFAALRMTIQKQRQRQVQQQKQKPIQRSFALLRRKAKKEEAADFVGLPLAC